MLQVRYDIGDFFGLRHSVCLACDEEQRCFKLGPDSLSRHATVRLTFGIKSRNAANRSSLPNGSLELLVEVKLHTSEAEISPFPYEALHALAFDPSHLVEVAEDIENEIR